MEWLFIAGLAAWAWRQSARADTLQRKLDQVSRGAARTPVSALEPLLLADALPNDDREPLLLDTPLPPASNDERGENAPAPPPPPDALAAALWLAAAPLAGIAIAVLLAPTLRAGLWLEAALVALAAGGFALAALLRSAWLASGVAAALLAAAAYAVFVGSSASALAAILTAVFGVTLLGLPSGGGAHWVRMQEYGAPIAASVGGVLTLATWATLASAPDGASFGAGLATVLLVGAASLMVRTRGASPALLTVVIALAIAGFIAYQQQRHFFATVGDTHYSMLLVVALSVVCAALAAKPHPSSGVLVAGAGAIGAGVLVLLAASSRADWHAADVWATLFVAAALLFAAANVARDGVSLWAGAAIVLTLIGVESAFPVAARSVGDAAAALVFAAAWARFGWPILRYACVVAAVLSVAQTLSVADAPTAGIGAALLIAAARVSAAQAPAYVHRTLAVAAALLAFEGLALALREAPMPGLWFVVAAIALTLAANIRRGEPVAEALASMGDAIASAWNALERWADEFGSASHGESPTTPIAGARRDRRRGRR